MLRGTQTHGINLAAAVSVIATFSVLSPSIVQRGRQWHEFRAHFRWGDAQTSSNSFSNWHFKVLHPWFLSWQSIRSTVKNGKFGNLHQEDEVWDVSATRRPRFPQKATSLPLSSSSTTAACHSQLSQRDEGGLACFSPLWLKVIE